MTAPVWTDADDAQLAKAWQDGVSFKEIATKMGRTRGAVSGRLHRLQAAGKVPAPMAASADDTALRATGRSQLARWTDEDDAEMMRLYRADVPLNDITKQISRTRKAMQSRLGLLRKAGHDLPERRIPRGPEVWPEAHLETLRREWDCKTTAQIGALIGRPAAAVGRMGKQLGLIARKGSKASTPVEQKLEPKKVAAQIAALGERIAAKRILPKPTEPVALPRQQKLPADLPESGAGLKSIDWPEILAGETMSSKLASMRAYLDALGNPLLWSVARDLELCAKIWAGKPYSDAEGKRFCALTAPLRDDRGRLPIEAASIVMAVLRERAAACIADQRVSA
jgi:transposase